MPIGKGGFEAVEAGSKNVGGGLLGSIRKTIGGAFERQARIDEFQTKENIRTSGYTDRAAVDIARKRTHWNDQISAANRAKATAGRDENGNLHEDFSLPGLVAWSKSKNRSSKEAGLVVEQEKTKREQMRLAQRERAAEAAKNKKGTKKTASKKTGVKKPKAAAAPSTRTSSNVNKPLNTTPTAPKPRKAKSPSTPKPVNQEPTVTSPEVTVSKPKVTGAKVKKAGM